MEGDDKTHSEVTALNDLISRLTLFAAASGYTLTTRLLEGGTNIELRASRSDAERTQEYSRLLRLSDIEEQGPAAVAREFTREARGALLKRVTPPAGLGPEHKARS